MSEEWRECRLAGPQVPDNIHPCARPCRAHLGFGDHVIASRCAVCKVPPIVEALQAAAPVVAGSAEFLRAARDCGHEVGDNAMRADRLCKAALAALEVDDGKG